VASDLELDLLRFAVAFYARGCLVSPVAYQQSLHLCIVEREMERGTWEGGLQEASFRRQISMNCLMSETSLGILAVEERGMRWVRRIGCKVVVAVAD